jgi:phosphatidylserine/phosphatidylglycerophosphate/cardiolipin synthase-like enzyme
VTIGGEIRTSERAASPELSVEVTGTADALITVRNVGRATLEGTLSVTAAEQEEPVPSFDVLFTTPLCHETGTGVRDGARCNGSEKDASREAAGIHARLLETLRSATVYKQAHPEAPVKITMTYLSWYYDGGLKTAVLDAIAAGVAFQGYFDPGYGVEIPAELEAMNHPNVRVGWLGGHADNEGTWRLMHIKLTMVDYGTDAEPMRIVFSSANLSPSGVSLHFENFVFARVARQSNFAQRHLCAMQGLEADKYPSRAETDTFADVFEQIYDSCVAQIAEPPDPALNVFFTPDENKDALAYLKRRMRQATTSIDMAIEHYSEWSLAGTQSWLAETIPSRLVLDDQTLYMDGESSQGDNNLWWGILRDSQIDQRFVRTNADIHQLQHNKYVVLDGQSVFCGAGNFTGAAFKKNYENFYLLDVPALAQQFQVHFDHMFDDLGSRLDEIPAPLGGN